MHHRARVLLIAMASALAISLLVGHASANRLSFSEQSVYFTWDEFQITPDAGGPIICAVTFLGSIHNTTISKVAGSLIGSITHAAVATCEGGTATLLTETLPWHITFQSYSGRLPFISGVRQLYVGISLAARPNELGVTCLARSSVTEPVSADITLNSEGVVTGADLVSELAIDVNDVGAGTLCDFLGSDASLEGTASVEDARAGPYLIQLV